MNQNAKLIAMFLVFASLTTMALGFIPRASAQPATTNMLINIYLDQAQVENALGIGAIDINDWPLSNTFINTYTSNPAITMNDYPELGMMEFDLNNQLWPTGPITTPRIGAKDSFFDFTRARDIAALHFRRAIAHLCNKAQYVGGYGYVMETIVPRPALESWTYYPTLYNSTANADPWSPGMGGYLYAYNRATAAQEFELGGFRDYDTDTFREWRDPGPDRTYGTGDDGPIEELPNMRMWCRLDDPNRRQVGWSLFNELLLAGIPQASGPGANGLELRIAERSSCFAAVMVAYDYNIYTGGWSVGRDPDFIFDLLHSSMGQYIYASNYPGFKNAEFDTYAAAVKYLPAGEDPRFTCIQAQWVANKYCPIVWLWCARGVKGYRTGWQNVVNKACYGTDNSWSFELMNWNPTQPYMTRNGPANTIVYGFKSDISALSVINSEWLWDWNALDLIYDSLIVRNPYNLTEEVGALATSWTTTDSYPGWEGLTVAEFTVRTDATFHDGTRVWPADIAYSILLVRAAGAGNAWNYPSVMDASYVQIAGNVVRVFFGVQSAWALHWAGFLPILNKDLWQQAVGSATYGGYNGFIADNVDGNYYPGTFTTSANLMRNYRIWESTAYGNPAVNDLAEDGSGPWSFVSYIVGRSIYLTAYPGFYNLIYRYTPPTYTSMPKSNFLNIAFNNLGNVNYAGGYGVTQGWYTADREIDIFDFGRIANSLTTTSSMTWGPYRGYYNPDADLNNDGAVNIFDLSNAGMNFYKRMG